MTSVGMFFDPIASMDVSVEAEYQEAEEIIGELLPGCRFERDVHPHRLANSGYKLYLFDVGGLGCMPGCGSSAFAMIRELARQVSERPDMLVVLWSSFTCAWYKEELEQDEEIKALTSQPNVVFRFDPSSKLGDELDDWRDNIRKWFGLPTVGTEDPIDKLKRARRTRYMVDGD